MSPVNGVDLAGDLRSGIDFKCTRDACYGIGKANHKLFEDLQTAINRWAATAGFPRIQVDGFLGDKTTSALDRIWPSNDASVKEVLAAGAHEYLNLLNNLANKKQLPVVSPPPTAAPSPAKKEAIAAKAADDKHLMHTPGLGPASPWYFIGGVAIIALGVIGYKIYKRRQEDTAIYMEQ